MRLEEHIAAETRRIDPDAGVVIDGRYHLREVIGSGAMGTVYRAEQLTVGRDVAVKILKSSLAENPRVRARFEQEARAVAKLRDPNSLTLHDFGYDTENDALYMVFNYVDGVPLSQFLGQPVPLHGALNVVLQVASALDHAHRNGVLHLDLKPANIMLEVTDRGDRARVLDFGLAHIFGEAKPRDQGEVFGSPAYMSPEQCRGEAEITASADIYALGCIAYELIEGELPFEASDAVAMLLAHQDEAAPPMQAVGVPEDVTELVSNMLAKDPTARPTADEVLDVLLDHVHIDVSLGFALGKEVRKSVRETLDLGSNPADDVVLEDPDPETIEFDLGIGEVNEAETTLRGMDFAPPRLIGRSEAHLDFPSDAGLEEGTHIGLLAEASFVEESEQQTVEISLLDAEELWDEDEDEDQEWELEEHSADDESGLDDLSGLEDSAGLDELSDLEESEPYEVRKDPHAERTLELGATPPLPEEISSLREEAPTIEPAPETANSRPWGAVFLVAIALGFAVIILAPGADDPVEPARVVETVVMPPPAPQPVTTVSPPYLVEFASDVVGLAVKTSEAASAAELAERRLSELRQSPTKAPPEPKRNPRRRPKKLEFRY